MNFVFEERLSDSPLVERVWRTHSDRAGSFMSPDGIPNRCPFCARQSR